MHFVSALAHYSDQYESVLMYFNLSKLKTSNPVAKNGVIWILLKYDTNHENLVRRLKSAKFKTLVLQAQKELGVQILQAFWCCEYLLFLF